MRKILISGYLGYGNFGDEALLYVLIKDLEQIGFRKQNISVITANEEYTITSFNVKPINRWNFFDIANAIINHDALIFIGGLFQDRTSFKSFLYYYAQLFFAQLLGKEVVFYGSGFGPFLRKQSKDLLNNALRNVNLITVRDQVSSSAVGLNLPITCDPVWSIEPDYSAQNQITKVDWKAPIVGVALRNDNALRKSHIDNLGERLSKIIFTTQDWQILLIPCMSEDIPVLDELEKTILKKTGQTNRLNYIRDLNNFSIPEQAGIFSSCDVMVGMRYHSLLVPLSCGKPVFGLIYDQKVKSLVDFAEQVSISFKDDMEKPWNYFWQNLERSTLLAKTAQNKACNLHKRNQELLEVLIQRG